ncbi:hypothetical protein, conserved [Leishmania donovani]|uniref:Acetyltransferase (GNAT) family protein n=1 Tax=Leishmania donovani TaxID=5661 RepID=A0A3S7X392_LEIDO|nr:hypothetical protein, conserved [Leishmania donovani]AYU80929.1 Acetyltransferase (GNAT) family, putative [Leishmania donovani]TPP45693.1 Acetyltransferase (GNAT) family protein [Leishmania donovani]CBZ36153.1 hypothetical protein, conserved [Leishmania donovani]
MRDGHLAPTATASLAAQFSVYCLEKPRQDVSDDDAAVPARESAPTSLPSKADLAAPLSYLDVVQQLDGDDEWSFAPYPRCSRAQLLQVHAYWVAIRSSAAPETWKPSWPKASDGASEVQKSEESASIRSAEEATTTPRCLCDRDDGCSAGSCPSADALRLACVVGIVWVRLSARTPSTYSLVNRRTPHNGQVSAGSAIADSPSVSLCRPSVEGYIQVVVTHPHYRRRGLASWLLTQCLACTEAPAGVFASDRRDGVAYAIERWHLHTLAATRRAAKRSRGDEETWTCQQDHPRPDQHHQDANHRRSEGEGSEAVVAATLAMYRRLGFHERRYLARYYAGKNDAVELMKMCL